MGCWDGDNNDGICVIDITNPADPSYCFVLDREPLSGEQYIRTYYPIPEDEGEVHGRISEDSVLKAVSGISGVKMVTLEVLAEAWPDEFRKALESRDAQKSRPKATDIPPDVESIVSSLTDISLSLAITHAVESGEDSELEQLTFLPLLGKASFIKSALRDRPAFPDAAVPLLVKALQELKETTAVDLSDFGLSSEQVVKIVFALGDGVDSLNLSFNPYITADGIRKILIAIPRLKRLVIMGCPCIEEGELFELLKSQPLLFKNMEALMHPAILDIRQPPVHPTTFTFVTAVTSLQGSSLAVFSPASVVQSLTDLIRVMWAEDANPRLAYTFDMYGGCAITAAFSGGARWPGQTWSERSVAAIPTLSPDFLRDLSGWAFVFQCHHSRRHNFYGFMRARPLEDVLKDASQTEVTDATASQETTDLDSDGKEHSTAQEPSPREQLSARMGRDISFFDLRDFLRVMEEEGRTLPSEDAIKELEDLLHSEEDGKRRCSMMTTEDAVDFFVAIRKIPTR
ncbi:hypothetical protein A0H81_08165 [Grifola frondosa]|uniref:Uncharacterized protein n=1 Tax=Grifola frondosa TaxID=5627 RepID=A0A1C7M699_GRIFR|nr:hypothetical protein A0H81_08165 [Grifola frondosa]